MVASREGRYTVCAMEKTSSTYRCEVVDIGVTMLVV